ncbi:MAG: 1-acyl-sn-glycerol-3-phosphate acyltransferase [Cyanobacteria bacterium J06573_11]
MPKTVQHVQPPLHFIPTHYTPWVIRLIHWVLPLLLRFRIRPWLPAGISRIKVEHVERLVDLYAQLEAGKVRFLMATRHVEVDDPLTGLYLCSRAVSKAAKAKGIKLQHPVHTHFIYERGMTIWAGKSLGWLLSRIGGTPIRRGRRPDWIGLKAARRLLTSGNMPMVVAPEGATNGHSERLGPLEPGVAQLGFWCAEDLQKEDRAETVYIIPIGIQYRYEQPSWTKLSQLLTKLEKESGLTKVGQQNSLTAKTTDRKNCYHRILQLGVHLLKTMEAFYSHNYPQSSSDLSSTEAETHNDASTAPEVQISKRLPQLLDSALSVSEQFFKLPGKGTLVDRCRRIEEASWQYIYREDLPDLKTLSPLEKGLADWAAKEASLRELHMRVVESFVAVDGDYLKENPSFERCAEVTLLMSDMLGRLSGDKRPSRVRLGKRWVKMTVQPPLSVSDRLPSYQANRRSGRVAVAALTEEIRLALEATIER